MKKLLKFAYTLPLAFTVMLAGCRNDKGGSSVTGDSSSEESSVTDPAPAYTPAEAIDAVAELASAALGTTITANHVDYGDYIVLNFGTNEISQIKSAATTYFVPEGFVLLMEDWASDTFTDGTPVDYIVYSWNGDVLLEFDVYTESSYEGSEADYNGNYLQIDAYEQATTE